MVISFSKLLPLMIAGGIAIHSRQAIEKRISAVVGHEFRAKHNMSVILHAIQLDTVGQTDVKIDDERAFIKKHATAKMGDATLDPWGTPYAIFFRSNRIYMVSAGRDKKFATKDDVAQSVELLNH